MSAEKRYQRLPKDEAHHDDDDDDIDIDIDHLVESSDSQDDTPNNPLVTKDTRNIFRSSPWKAVPDHDASAATSVAVAVSGADTNAAIVETASTATSTASSPRKVGSNITTSSLIGTSASQLQVMISRSHSTKSFDMDNDDDDDDWQVDDDVAVRRYHLDFAADLSASGNNNNNNAAAAAAANFASNSSSLFPKRLWQAFLELRASARQRRAARLLTMPSESFPYKLHACLLTWCCDATDRGIGLVLFGVAAWLLIGLVGSTSPAWWWWMGVLLFVTRVTARRLLESWQDAKRKMRRRQRLSTSSEVQVLDVLPGGTDLQDVSSSMQIV
jgi:hypothetical protein